MLSGAAFQPLMGLILDYVWDGTRLESGEPVYSLAAYETSIATVPICCLAAGLCLVFIKETYQGKAVQKSSARKTKKAK